MVKSVWDKGETSAKAFLKANPELSKEIEHKVLIAAGIIETEESHEADVESEKTAIVEKGDES